MAKEFDIPATIEQLKSSISEDEKICNPIKYMDTLYVIQFLNNKNYWVKEFRSHTAAMLGVANANTEKAEQDFWNSANILLDKIKEEGRYKK